MHSSIALVALAAAGGALAKTIQIDVGKGGLVFSPDTSTAAVGDTLEFHFYSAFHTAVQGDFSTPCQRGSLWYARGHARHVANIPYHPLFQDIPGLRLEPAFGDAQLLCCGLASVSGAESRWALG